MGNSVNRIDSSIAVSEGKNFRNWVKASETGSRTLKTLSAKMIKNPGKTTISQMMRRVIEESVEKRKKAQSEVDKVLNELGELLENSTLFKKNKNNNQGKILPFQ